MIIKTLTLHNYRVFNGVHEINLSPSTDEYGIERPVILFGGLNGAGKTSILSAVRLLLLGRQAFDRVLTNQEYTLELDNLIHKGNGIQRAPEEASIEMIFTYVQGTKDSEYSVIRSWAKGKKDKLSISIDGEIQSAMGYEQCQGFLNELVPPGIADLFFFDGEKIASLAEDESGKILKTAVRRLLGIDLISRLRTDLEIFLKRSGLDSLPEKVRLEIESLQTQIKQENQLAENARQRADSFHVQIIHTTKQITEHENTLNSMGGAWAHSKETERSKISTLSNQKESLEKSLRTEIEGFLPLAFAPKMIQGLIDKLEQENETRKKITLNDEISLLRDKVLKVISRDNEQEKFITEIASIFDDNFRKNAVTSSIEIDLSEREFSQVANQFNNLSTRSFEKFQTDTSTLINVEEELDNASVNIERAPDEESLQDIFNSIRTLEVRKSELTFAYKEELVAAKMHYKNCVDLARKEQKLHDKLKDQLNSSNSIRNAHKAISVLDTFSEAITNARVRKLETEFIASYKNLARKEDLEIEARINPNNFDVELVDNNGNSINRKALSAGEKQIYAISILEALGRTSGKKLPVIIDTPLGRLDSQHRIKLVQNYFPDASHQMVILSTDTEIDQDYFKDLVEDISHAYEIKFDATTKSSSLTEGYFWA